MFRSLLTLPTHASGQFRLPIPVVLLAPIVIVLATLGNLAYLSFACPLELAPDEAHYWDWSRNLDWSYYSKGPLVAWLIAASCALLGDTMLAVRLPAILCHALLLSGIWQLARQSLLQERSALLVVVLSLTIPSLAAPSIIMTIDGPFLACWTWACVLAQRGLQTGHTAFWIGAGVVIAIGILAKYTMLLFPVCLALYLLAIRRVPRGFLGMLALAVVGLIPIGVWNTQHDWVSFRHVSTLAGSPGVSGWDPRLVLSFLAGQFGLLVGYWFVAWLAAVIVFRPGRDTHPPFRFLWWMSVPVFLVFLLASFQTRGQPNWPVAAYLPGLILVVAWILQQFQSSSRIYRRICLACLISAILLGVTMTLVSRWPGVYRPFAAQIAGPPTASDPTPVRKLDPTSRLTGWRTLAAAVDQLRIQEQTESGIDPVVATMTWTLPGELAFYCQGHPKVYSLGSALADRHSQYDLWRPNPLADAQAFRGRTFVYVGEVNLDLLDAFDRFDPPVEVLASDGGIPIAIWKVRVLRGFRGWPTRTRVAGY